MLSPRLYRLLAAEPREDEGHARDFHRREKEVMRRVDPPPMVNASVTTPATGRMPTLDGLAATELLRARPDPPEVIVPTPFHARRVRASCRCRSVRSDEGPIGSPAVRWNGPGLTRASTVPG